LCAQARPAETAPIAAQQIRRDATLIEKDVLPRVAQRQPIAPAASLSGDVGSPLFVGVSRFFEREVQLPEGAPDRRQAS
jgi:hypothetical protein